MILPNSRYIIVWNIIMTMVYLIAIIMDTLIIGFHLRLLLIPEYNIWQMIFSAIMIIDIILRFFIAIRQSQNENEEEKEEDNEEEMSIKVTKNKVEAEESDDDGDDVAVSKKQKLQKEMQEREEALIKRKEEERINRRKREIERRNAVWYDPQFEKRFSIIAKKYTGQYYIGYFLFDCLACIPVLSYEASDGFSTHEEFVMNHIDSRQYQIFWGFKTFKFLMLSRIMQSLMFIETLLKE